MVNTIEKMSELKDVTIKTTQNETKHKIKKITASVNCGKG